MDKADEQPIESAWEAFFADVLAGEIDAAETRDFKLTFYGGVREMFRLLEKTGTDDPERLRAFIARAQTECDAHLREVGGNLRQQHREQDAGAPLHAARGGLLRRRP